MVAQKLAARHIAPETGDAIELARVMLANGHRIDVGLMQVNVGAGLNEGSLPLKKAFDPRTNFRLKRQIAAPDGVPAARRSESLAQTDKLLFER